MSQVSYDVVIPTHANGEAKGRSLELVLSALAKARTHPDSIIVVNNGEASHYHRRWLSEICTAYGATIVELEKPSRARARNVGAARSSAQYLLFCDDDIIAGPVAVQLALDRASSQHFCCGARRRFVPMTAPRERVSRMVDTQDWDALDRLSNDTRVPESGWRSEFTGLQYHSSYIGCFGLVPRATFEAVGGFDERFEGWGLEDTEIMRRLLGVLGFHSLRDATVWHLDHLVSPYIWEEHWGRNLEVYCDQQREKPMLDLGRLFSVDSCEPADRNILIPPPKETGRDPALIMKLEPELSGALNDYLAEAERDDGIAGVILSGSTLWSQHPEDLDLEKVVFVGDTACRRTWVGAVAIDEHVVRLSAVRHTLHKPFFYPETWPWIANRYFQGVYLHQKVDMERMFRNSLPDVIHRNILHLLTFHLGRALKAASREYLADRFDGLKHGAVLACLSEGMFPDRMNYPYSGSTAVRRIVNTLQEGLGCDDPARRRNSVLTTLEEVVSRLVTVHDLEGRGGPIYYSISEEGLGALCDMRFRLRAFWGKITNDYSTSDRLIHLYGFVQHHARDFQLSLSGSQKQH